MKIGFTSLTLRSEDVSDTVKYAKAAGLEGIEWGVSDNHVILGNKARAEEIKKICKENCIEIFSMGSYCRMLDKDECVLTVETAAMLSAPVIRIWAGAKAPLQCDDSEFEMIAENTRFMADVAEKHGISLGFEFHHGTLTETAQDAVKLIKSVNRKNVGLYWQPNYDLNATQNVVERNIVLPYCIGNLHVQNYSRENGYGLLSEIESTLKSYYGDIKEKPYNLMIEFVKDASPENLMQDADTLRKILA